MSIPVPLDRLRDEVDRRPLAYLLTVGSGPRAHAVAVPVAWDGDDLVVEAGGHSTANATERPTVTLLWPPPVPDGYSLLVDGLAAVDGARVTVSPTRAVLHRPAPTGAPLRPGCTADCEELLPGRSGA